jgi:hypothetical protein
MAVGLRLKFPGGTEEQYEAVHQKIDVVDHPPKGMLFHASGPIEEGWGVIDFWESRAAFDKFLQERLRPAVQELGSKAPQSPPDIKEFPVHDVLAGKHMAGMN